MIVVGLNAYHGDVSAALVRDGRLVAAVEEERYRRIKHCSGFPHRALAACLEMAGVSAREIDHFAVSRDPRAHLWRKALFVLRNRPKRMVGDRARNLLRIRSLPETIAESLGLDRAAVRRRMVVVEHHPAHLASAAYVSPFESAAVCAIDGFGDFVSTSWGAVDGNRVRVHGRVYFPHSLGLLYLAVTQHLGFMKYGDEFKVMGLAPYGEPAYTRELGEIVHVREDGTFELDLSYFSHWSEGSQMTWNDGEPTLGRVFTPKLEALLGPARNPADPIEAKHEAIAASLQRTFEGAALKLLAHVQRTTGRTRLCLAGGCAMNSVANGQIPRSRTGFREVFIQPAAADNGTALGAAFEAWHRRSGASRDFVMNHSYWGPEFSAFAVASALDESASEIRSAGCRRSSFDAAELVEWTARQIASGRVVGWFQGRMEWGSRALGNRSILADPRRPDMREIINTRIKFRERFRPFAPSILEEAAADYFVDPAPDPFMQQVYPIRPDKRSIVPAVTHVDGSGRLQTVSRDANPRYWSLIKAFEKLTGVPMVLNTSFNENEPIVLTPREAIDCFLRTSMDVIVLNNEVVERPPVVPQSDRGTDLVSAADARRPGGIR